MVEPIVLFAIQFTFVLVAYALIARWYVFPRLSSRPPVLALVPLIWVHVFAGSAGRSSRRAQSAPECRPGPRDGRLRRMATAVLALVALVALRARGTYAIGFVWVCVALGMLDTANAIIQSMRYHVFTYPLGVNWIIVTLYVPALLVSSF